MPVDARDDNGENEEVYDLSAFDQGIASREVDRLLEVLGNGEDEDYLEALSSEASFWPFALFKIIEHVWRGTVSVEGKKISTKSVLSIRLIMEAVYMSGWKDSKHIAIDDTDIREQINKLNI